MELEKWEAIAGYEDIYEVSSLGRVKSLKRVSDKGYYISEKILKLYNNRGYSKIGLRKKGERQKFAVHRLVAQAFIPNPDNLPEVNHINGVKDDNRKENLEWVTNSENSLHAYKIGVSQSPALKGEENGSSKLTGDDVIFIRENPDGLSRNELSQKFNISPSQIGRIINKKSWLHV